MIERAAATPLFSKGQGHRAPRSSAVKDEKRATKFAKTNSAIFFAPKMRKKTETTVVPSTAVEENLSPDSLQETLAHKLVEMATKKKQDEKNLKLLRELTALASNKHCFDCQQRGPTYVNMTIGSFVCTTCSGLL